MVRVVVCCVVGSPLVWPSLVCCDFLLESGLCSQLFLIDLSIFNVDKDSIVISKETPIIHQPTTGLPTTTKTNEPREESDEDPTMDEVDETEMDDEPPPTPTLASTMTMDSIFGDDPLFEELKELVENTEQEPEEVIPLLATTLTNNRVNKRPKFKARSKKK